MTAKEKEALDGIREILCYAVFELERGKIHPEPMNIERVKKLLEICERDFLFVQITSIRYKGRGAPLPLLHYCRREAKSGEL